MGLYRQVQTQFWTDIKVSDTMSPEDRYFYLYLLTNPQTNLCGCYEFSFKTCAFEMGYDIDTVKKLVQRFIEYKIIDYDNQTNELLILNYGKHNWTKSPKYLAGVINEVDNIKSQTFKDYVSDQLEKIKET